MRYHLLLGLIAGLIATAVLSVFLLVKAQGGVMPEFDVIRMLSEIGGAPDSPAVGWSLLFFIWAVAWGLLFAWVQPLLQSSYWFRGLVFATGAWAVFVLVFMPMAGNRPFGLDLGLGLGPAMMMLFLHWVYGLVLGAVYHSLEHAGTHRAAPHH